MTQIRGATVALSETSALPGDETLERLATRMEGLSAEEAAARLAQVGPNAFPRQQGASLIWQFLAEMVHAFALMLWIAAALSFIAEMPQLGVAIILVVILNGAFSFAQEYRADRAVRALSALLPETAVVRRGGRRLVLPGVDLVPGDILLLKEGDRICADCRVMRSAELKVDLSTLTGESEPSLLSADVMAQAPRDSIEANNVVFAGTFVTSGSAIAVVVATGSATRLGSISALTGRTLRRSTPLRIQLDRAVRVIGACAVGVGIVFFAAALVLGTNVRDGFLFCIGVIVALVPEGLLPTLSLSLAMSARRMARRGALIRRLESVETLGATTVICTDKTGTLTTNQMTARTLVLPTGRYEATGSGYDPEGTILADGGRPLAEEESSEVHRMLEAAALCGDARVEQQSGNWHCNGDPTEGALIVLARKGGIERENAERTAPRLREFPFESVRQRMSTMHRRSSGACEVFSKGSPEAILPLCSRICVNAHGLALGPDESRKILSDVDALAASGLRVLAFARRQVTGPVPQSARDAEQDMEFLGLVGMADAIRPEVPAAVASARQAGIRVVMITGDHPSTALSVARQAGISAEHVVLGADLPEEDAALGDLLLTRAPVLARVAPEQKLRIARVLQTQGEVVAMTGDGVNDAPALRQADIGIAMGRTGTDVAREAADLVLLDDNFAHIVEAVEEGRAAYDNIRRFLTYHLTDNVAELAPFVFWVFSGGAVPLMISVLQVLALDIGTDLLPALALGAEPPEPGVMSRPPRPLSARLLDYRILGRAFGFLGPLEALFSMVMLPVGAAWLFGWPALPLPQSGVNKEVLSTMVFAAIAVMQMANALECRSTRDSLFSVGPFSNPLLTGAVAFEGLLLLVFVYVPVVARVLGHQPLAAMEWLPILATPVAFLGFEEMRKVFVRVLGKRGGL